MKKLLFGALLLCASFDVFSQVDTSFIYNTSMPYGTLDLRIAKSATRYYYLQEGVTFSFRETPEGVRTNMFRDMTASWNSTPYQQGNMREKNGNADLFVLNYRILFPQNYNPDYDPGYPIIMMMHGAGETGNCWGTNCHWADPYWNPNTNNPPAPTDQFHELLNNDRNLFHGGLQHMNAVNAAAGKFPDDPTLTSKAFPGIVLFPQSLNGWSQPTKVEEAIKLLRLIIKKYNVDENRVYVHGLSNGGWGVNQALKRAPWLFACALTMSAVSDAEIPQHNQLPEVAKLPLWIFQGGQDTNPTPSKTFNWVKKLRDAGAVIRYYLYPSLGHGTWNTAYKEPDFFTWILSQRKYNPHVSYGNPVICNTTGAGVRISFSKGFLAYQWEKDGVIISGENKEELIANTPGVYRGRFSRKSAAPSESQWEEWSDPINVSEVNPAKPSINVLGSTHLRGPGLTSTDANNMVQLTASVNADLYDWYKNGQPINFQNTDIDDTLKTATITSGSSNANGQYTLVIRNSYCPSPSSDPVYLFFNNSAPVNMTLNNTAFGLRATPGSSSIFLSWNDVIENELGYEIWRRKPGSASFVFVAKTAKDAISYRDSGLEPATSYEYKLRAVSKTGRSNYVPSDNLSTNFVATTLGDTEAPLPPQNVTTTYNTVSSISIRWDAAQDDNGIKEYIIQYGDEQVTVPASIVNYTIENLQANTNYPITIQAVDYAGHISQSSNQIIATTFVKGLYYKHSTGVWVDLDDTTMVATFEHPEFTGWVPNFTLTPRTQEDFFNFEFNGYINLPENGNYFFRTTSDDGSRLILDDSVVVDNDGKHGNKTIASDTVYLAAGLHKLSVQYFDNEGNQNLVVQYKGPGIGDGVTYTTIPEAALKSGDVVPLVPPTAPGNLTATVDGMNAISLTWSASPETAVKYEIYRADTTGIFTKVGETTTVAYTDSTGLRPSGLYTYKVTATNQNGTSDFSNTATLTTSADNVAPSVPLDVTVLSKSPNAIALSWSAASDNDKVDHYEIYINDKPAGTSESNTFTITNLNSNVYTITVKAVDYSGNKSEASTALTVDNTIPGMYYSMAEGDLTSLSTWKKTSDGTGSSPSNFSDPGQTFVIANRTATTLTASWAIGNNSKVVVGDGITLDLNADCSCAIELKDNARLNVNAGITPFLTNLSSTSTVNLNGSTTVPAVSYGNLILSGTGSKTFVGDSTIVNGNLTINDGLQLIKGGIKNTLTVGGDLTFNESGTTAVKTHDLHLFLTANSLHTIQVTGDVALSKITVQDNSTVKINSNLPVEVTVGGGNGGGLYLLDNSTFNLGHNNLKVAGAGAINPANTNGRISVDNSNLTFASSASANSNLYIDSFHNLISKLLINNSGTGKLVLRSELHVNESVKIQRGVLNSNGFLKMLSTSNTTASVEKIEADGLLEGAITLQKFYPAAGSNVIREITAPLSGVKVEKLQQYFPVTGNFTGASPGSTDPSLFRSNGAFEMIPYPSSGSSNQQLLEVGKGYAANLLTANDTSSVTLEVTGLPTVGNFNVPLYPGNGTINSGWNLVGNPYPSNIVIDNTVVRSGLSNFIAVRDITADNGSSIAQYKYYDLLRSTPIIKRGQAFWIQSTAATPTLQFSESSKTNAEAANVGAFEGMTITLTDGTLSDQTVINVRADASDSYDPTYDVRKRMNAGMFSFSSMIDGAALAINAVKTDECAKSIPLQIVNALPGSYRISASSVSALQISSVALMDSFTGKQIILNDNAVYDFEITTDSSSYYNRFTILLMQSGALPTVSWGKFCHGDDAILQVADAGSAYIFSVTNNEGENIGVNSSDGTTTVITVDKSSLNEGENMININIQKSGCPTTVTYPYRLNYPQKLHLTSMVESEVVCKGSNALLTVNATEPMKELTWMGADFEKIATTPTQFFAMRVDAPTTAFVTGHSMNDCQADTLSFTLNVADGPEPVLELANDTLFVDSPGPYQWYKDGEMLTSGSESFLPVSDAGSYFVSVTSASCVAGSNVVLYQKNITGISPDVESVALSVYPIPSDGNTLNILVSSVKTTANAQITIADVIGNVIVSKAYRAEADAPIALDFPKKLAPGIYFVIVTSDFSAEVKRFIVKQ